MRHRLLLFSGLILLTSSAWGLDLSEIRTQVRRIVRDTSTDTTLIRYSSSVLNGHINEGQRDFVNSTWAIEISTDIGLATSTSYYDLPTDLIAVIQVLLTKQSGDVVILEEQLEVSYRQRFPDFEQQKGDPVEYYLRQSTSGANPLELGVSPVPSVSTQEGTLAIRYYGQPTDLSSDTDVPFNGLNHLFQYHHALVYYVSAKIKIIEGSLEEGLVLGSFYNTWVSQATDRINRSPNYRPNFSAGGISSGRGRAR